MIKKTRQPQQKQDQKIKTLENFYYQMSNAALSIKCHSRISSKVLDAKKKI